MSFVDKTFVKLNFHQISLQMNQAMTTKHSADLICVPYIRKSPDFDADWTVLLDAIALNLFPNFFHYQYVYTKSLPLRPPVWVCMTQFHLSWNPTYPSSSKFVILTYFPRLNLVFSFLDFHFSMIKKSSCFYLISCSLKNSIFYLLNLPNYLGR